MKSLTIEPAAYGRLVHEILALVVPEARRSGDPDVAPLLSLCAEYLPPEQAVEAEKGLRVWLEANAEDLANADRIDVEKPLAVYLDEDGYVRPCDFDDPKAWLRGIPDRVDFWDGGERAVIHDYKTGWSGHNALQGLVYSVLLFAAEPQVKEARVVYSNPIRGYVSPAYAIERATSEQIRSLFATIDGIRKRYEKPFAVSYSGLATWYRCPRSFWYHYRDRGKADPERFPVRPNTRCGWCDGLLPCAVGAKFPDSVANDGEAVLAAKLYILLVSARERVMELLKAYTSKDGADKDVEVREQTADGTTKVWCFGWKAPEARPRIKDVKAVMDFIEFVNEKLGVETYAPDKIFTVKNNKTVRELVLRLRDERPDAVEFRSGNIRFMADTWVESEGEG